MTRLLLGFVLGLATATATFVGAGDYGSSPYESMKEFQRHWGIDAPFEGIDSQEKRDTYVPGMDTPC